jgi:hypothetical protein
LCFCGSSLGLHFFTDAALSPKQENRQSRIPGVLVREYTASAVQGQGLKYGDLAKLGR